MCSRTQETRTTPRLLTMPSVKPYSSQTSSTYHPFSLRSPSATAGNTSQLFITLITLKSHQKCVQIRRRRHLQLQPATPRQRSQLQKRRVQVPPLVVKFPLGFHEVVLHHHHHHRLDSPTWALAFLKSFCQLKYPAVASSDFVTSLFQGGIASTTPNPRLSWRAHVFCQGCLP
jgi:hypothetical protein